jgi:glycosyltransferase involved in cell wall biosynthesis
VKVLLTHNAYQQRGGEDRVVEAEARLLQEHGHTVVRYGRHNDELRGRGPLATLSAGIETIWASGSLREMKSLISREEPDVVHFHNTFPLISPAVYYACAEAGVPVVQTLHNYRLLCPAALFLRDGKVCEECLGWNVALPGMLHRCYRGSRIATAAVTAMLAVHRAMGTWREKVAVYIALTEFARRKFIAGGLPAERIVVKPNFVASDPGPRQGPGQYALYVGRLSEEKGLRVLMRAWGRLSEPIPLRIAGDGPLVDEIADEIRGKEQQRVELLGRLPQAEITRLMHGARFLVLPSVCYENFPLTVAEAFACGLPVIASRLGAMAEIIEDGATGLHFVPGDAQDLAAKVEWAWSHPEELGELGGAARIEYQSKYTWTRNYERTMNIYARAMKRSDTHASWPAREPSNEKMRG